MRKFAIWVMLLSFVSQSTFGQMTSTLSSPQNGSEYFVGKEMGMPLITVQLLSGVKFAGVYHVPMETDLAQLIAYAGGTVDNAEVETIFLRRTKKKEITLMEFDLRDLFTTEDKPIPIEDRDVIAIPIEKGFDNFSRRVQLVGLFASIILSTFLMYDIYKRNTDPPKY